MDTGIPGYYFVFEANPASALSCIVTTAKPEQSLMLHPYKGVSIRPPFPQHLQQVMVGMGCFWGAERIFWSLPEVYVTAVGYSGGTAPQPDYPQVCAGETGHAEVVLVVFDPGDISFRELLTVFWENHDPTQGNRQGHDVGSQYRSAIFTYDASQQQRALQSRQDYARALNQAHYPDITTEIKTACEFFYAEPYHQQYLLSNPQGYCAHTSTGIRCPNRKHSTHDF